MSLVCRVFTVQWMKHYEQTAGVNSTADQLSRPTLLCSPAYSLIKSTTNLTSEALLKLNRECVSKVSYSLNVRINTGVKNL